VEREQNFRINPQGNATTFPTLGDFELQHLLVEASDADLEERIIRHLVAAAAMGRAPPRLKWVKMLRLMRTRLMICCGVSMRML